VPAHRQLGVLVAAEAAVVDLLRPTALALLMGAVGVVGFGQLSAAGVIAEQVAQVRVGLMHQPLLLQPL
jgi:hypothetical protein